VIDIRIRATLTVTVPRILSLVIASIVAASVLVGVAPTAAMAEGVPTGALLGNDVSAPQCSGANAAALPAAPAFAIIGVNSGVANKSNPCFAAQLAWAQSSRGGTKQPAIAFYVNTANPGLAASWWPTSNLTQPATADVPRTQVSVPNPYGDCAGAAGAACAFVYGYSMALDDATVRGVPDPGAQTWWLDVEEINSWDLLDKPANVASLEGMAALFSSLGARVGLYSTQSHWLGIVGVVPASSSLYTLPSWIAMGPTTEAKAMKGCGQSPLTAGGRVSVTQFLAAGFDYNVSCLKFTSRPKAKVTGTGAVGKKLAVKVGSWHPTGVKLTYRWYRDNVPITKATHKTYTLRKADAGTKITVTVTAKKTGYSTVAKTSKAKKVSR
jgi:hypothetical protein